MLNEILRFLDLDPLRFHVSDQVWKIHRRTNPIRNMNGESVARLTLEDRRTIQRIAGSLLSEYDYLGEVDERRNA